MKKFVCTLMGLVALSFANAQSSREIQSLNEILKATDATWTAAENEVTRMNAIEQEKLFGLLPAVGEMSLLPEETISTEAVRAERFEAAHTPIKNQGSCGSCYSFGASASYEGWKLKAGQTTDLSEQDFMMTAKSIGPHGGCSGWYLDTSMNLLKDKGVANESACPYKAVETACPSSASKVHKIGAWSRTSDLATIKSALANYGPVYTGFAVYGDFMSYKGGIYKYTSGSLRGYHAVAIVGYDDATQCFKVKNSWGTGWGEGGYFRIHYSQMTNSVQFGTCFGGSYYITR